MLCKSTGSQLLGCESEMDLSSVLIIAVKNSSNYKQTFNKYNKQNK